MQMYGYERFLLIDPAPGKSLKESQQGIEKAISMASRRGWKNLAVDMTNSAQFKDEDISSMIETYIKANKNDVNIGYLNISRKMQEAIISSKLYRVIGFYKDIQEYDSTLRTLPQ